MSYIYNIKEFILESYRLSSNRLNGIFYHGGVIQPDEDVLRNFSFGYSDWDAIWFTDREDIADEFGYNKGSESDIQVIYEVSIKCPRIANLMDKTVTDYLIDKLELDDFREIIPYLKQKGFIGWITTGSIGRKVYDDIAIFDLSYVTVKRAKFKIDNKYSEFMSLEEADEILQLHKDNG